MILVAHATHVTLICPSCYSCSLYSYPCHPYNLYGSLMSHVIYTDPSCYSCKLYKALMAFMDLIRIPHAIYKTHIGPSCYHIKDNLNQKEGNYSKTYTQELFSLDRDVISFKILHSSSSDTLFNPLPKQAYSNILKVLPPKNENFQIKNQIFFIFLLKT